MNMKYENGKLAKSRRWPTQNYPRPGTRDSWTAIRRCLGLLATVVLVVLLYGCTTTSTDPSDAAEQWRYNHLYQLPD